MLREVLSEMQPGKIRALALDGVILGTRLEDKATFLEWALRCTDTVDLKAALDHYGTEFQHSTNERILKEWSKVLGRIDDVPEMQALLGPLAEQYGRNAATSHNILDIYNSSRALGDLADKAFAAAAERVALTRPLSVPQLGAFIDLAASENRGIMQWFANEDPAAANNFALGLEQGQEALAATFSCWLSSDPVAASEWVNQLQNPGAKSDLAGQIVNHLREVGDVEAAAKWQSLRNPADSKR